MMTPMSFSMESGEREFLVGDQGVGQPNLRAGHLFDRSWEVFERETFLVVGIFCVSVLVDVFLSGMRDGNGSGGIFGVIGIIIYGPMRAGINHALVRLMRKESVAIGRVFSGFLRFWPAAGVSILAWLAMMLGFICLLVPGIVIGLGLIPCMYLVLEEKLGVRETLSRAWSITQGHKKSLLKLAAVLVVCNFGGFLLCGVGIIFTGAFSMLVVAAAYDELYQSAISFDQWEEERCA